MSRIVREVVRFRPYLLITCYLQKQDIAIITTHQLEAKSPISGGINFIPVHQNKKNHYLWHQIRKTKNYDHHKAL